MTETIRCDDKDTLVAYLYGEIDADERREVERHLRTCAACAEETDLAIHGCGTPTRRIRGAAWCDNDVVNVIATASGAVVAMAIDRALAGRERLSAPEIRPAPR